MPIPVSTEIPAARTCSTKGGGAGAGVGISLPVLADPKRTIKKSKMGPWRAAALVLVQLAIAGHITLWVITGMRETLSPVEPSESMYTLEKGLVNAGFVFFLLAILSTFV